MTVQTPRVSVFPRTPGRYLEPPLPIVGVFESWVFVNPSEYVIGSVGLPALVLDCSVGQVHPARTSGRILVYRDRLVVVPVNPKVEFAQIDQATRPEC